MQNFSGICIEGPYAGKRRSCGSPTLYVPVMGLGNMIAGKFEYRYKELLVENTDKSVCKICCWVPTHFTETEILQTLFNYYANNRAMQDG